ncbi:hypothetical protein J2W96_006256 [Variovorax guangxiensis]|nr:hypothetical protein [Variovorax guangxiensis]MDR6859916.1 hypothetical protein [Variovorax guangxiensis]
MKRSGARAADHGIRRSIGHERVRAAAIFQRRCTPARDADRVFPPGVDGQGRLDAQIVNPHIAEVVLVNESLKAPQLQLTDQSLVSVGIEERAALLVGSIFAAGDLKAVQVHVLPTESDLEDVVQLGDACIDPHQQPAPDQRTDAPQHCAQLQDSLRR